MRLAVQQLLGSSAAVDLLRCTVQRAEEHMTVALRKGGGLVSGRDQPLSRCDSIHEVRRRDLDTSHPPVQTLERVCVVGRYVVVRSHLLVVGPQGHREVMALVDPRFDPRLERRHGARLCSQSLSELDLTSGALLPSRCYSSEDVTRQQT